MSTRILLYIPGLTGYSTADKRSGWHDVGSVTWKTTTAIGTILGTGAEIGKAELSEVRLTMDASPATPEFFQNSAVVKRFGGGIPSTISDVSAISLVGLDMAGTTTLERWRHTFSPAYLTSVEFSDSQDGGAPILSVTIAAGSVLALHRRFNPDGSIRSSITRGWDYMTNRPFGNAGP